MSIAAHLALIAVLLLLSAFFSGSEAAIFSLSNIEKRRLEMQHPVIWKTVFRLLDQPRRTLITLLIGNMVVNTLMVTVVTLITLKLFGAGGVAWTIALLTVVLLLVGELTPKVFAVRNNVRVASVCAIPVDFFARLLFPVRRIVRWVSDYILSFLVRGKYGEADLVSEEELKTLARIGEEEGALRGDEGIMIQRLINLGSRIVQEIMTPRTDIVGFNIHEGRERLVELIRKNHFTYYPVYEGSLDQIIGFVFRQDVILESDKKLEELIIPPLYVPETKPVDELLFEFQQQKHRCAICIDEYGGTAGLVTLEDVIEEVFGEFYDEYAREELAIHPIDENRFLVSGKTGLHELKEKLDIEIFSEKSETVSGWIFEQLGRVPALGESFCWKNLEIHVKEVRGPRIQKVEIRRKK